MAAGESSRFGSCKVIHKINGTPMLERVLNSLPAKLQVFVVTGGYKVEVEEFVRSINYPVVHNPNFHRGLGTSVKKAIEYSMDQYDYLLVTLADLPFVEEEDYLKIVAKRQEAPVFSVFNGKEGPPFLIGKEHYNFVLKNMDDSGGGKKLFQNKTTVSVPNGARDVDHIEDLRE